MTKFPGDRIPGAIGLGFGSSVIAAGLFMLPAAAVQLVFGPYAVRIERRFGRVDEAPRANRGTQLVSSRAGRLTKQESCAGSSSVPESFRSGAAPRLAQ